jgi:hypothetical protein
MDRFVPRRRAALLPVFLCFALAVAPRPVAHAALPNIYEPPAGDPGDGVLRPAGHEMPSGLVPAGRGDVPVTTLAPQPSPVKPVTAGPTALRLVPILPPPGQPWLLTFRLVRVDLDMASAGDVRPVGSRWGGRWHRAF